MAADYPCLWGYPPTARIKQRFAIEWDLFADTSPREVSVHVMGISIINSRDVETHDIPVVVDRLEDHPMLVPTPQDFYEIPATQVVYDSVVLQEWASSSKWTYRRRCTLGYTLGVTDPIVTHFNLIGKFSKVVFVNHFTYNGWT